MDLELIYFYLSINISNICDETQAFLKYIDWQPFKKIRTQFGWLGYMIFTSNTNSNDVG